MTLLSIVLGWFGSKKFVGRERTFPCPYDWVVGPNDNCYKIVRNPKKNFNDAQSECESLGGTLATLDTLEEITWMRGYRALNLDTAQKVWVAGKQSSGR